MTLYVGHTITVRASAKDAITDEVISTADAVTEFYEPGKNPRLVPADRTVDVSTPMFFDADSASYVCYQNTDGFTPGKWSYRVVLSGTHDVWQYSTFILKA